MGKTQQWLEKAEMVNLCHVRPNQRGFHSFMLQEPMGVTPVKEREKLPASLQPCRKWVISPRRNGLSGTSETRW